VFRHLTQCKLSLCLDHENNQVNSEHRELSRRATKVNLDTNIIGLETVKVAKDTSESTRSNVMVRLERAFILKNYELNQVGHLDHHSTIARVAIFRRAERYPPV
jgi:hypothetical protein